MSETYCSCGKEAVTAAGRCRELFDLPLDRGGLTITVFGAQPNLEQSPDIVKEAGAAIKDLDIPSLATPDAATVPPLDPPAVAIPDETNHQRSPESGEHSTSGGE